MDAHRRSLSPRGNLPGTAAVLLLAVLGAGCGSGATPTAAPSPAPTVEQRPQPAGNDLQQLDAAFPIDIDRIDATFDLFPAEHRIQASAAVAFHLRAGQARPLVHFEPARGTAPWSLSLDGQALDVHSAADVRQVRYATSTQVGIELQRTPGAGGHRLEAGYTLALSDGFGRFYTDVNDLAGRGNEVLFPTLNSPRELARHVLTFRVHAAEPYRLVGSGLVSARTEGDVQVWTLDTEREVASYTVLFYLVPARDVLLVERTVDGVPVRVLSYVGGPATEDAFAQLEAWLPELRANLGPFPMPRGLSVVLTPSGGGMEYFGGTITSLRALRHEVFHMYYGCSTVALTYRDSWWDEAINMWYELSADPAFAPIPEEFRSDMVSGRTPIAVGFDQRAYVEGARVFQAVAADLGGRGPLVALLREIHEARSFDPFSTMQLADEIQVRRGVDEHARFQAWLYTGGTGAALGVSPHAWLHQVDLTPPPGVERR